MYETDFLRALSVTIVTETVLLFALIRVVYRIETAQLRGALILFGGVLASAATLPYIWFVFPAFITHHGMYVFAAESFAVCTEAVILWFLFSLSCTRSFSLSLACNLCSWMLGEFLF